MLGEELRNRISDLIISGELRPGDRLDEQVLADRFGVSRTPVREALHQLVASGLVDMRPRRPTIVRRMGEQELAASFEALGEIEGLCAGFAAERMSSAERLELQHLLETAEDVVAGSDMSAYRELDARFHQLIHDGAHNESLGRVVSQLRMQVAPYSTAPYTLTGHTRDVLIPHRQHVTIAEAILSRERHRATAAMIDHISRISLELRHIFARVAAGEATSTANSPAGAGSRRAGRAAVSE